MLYDAAEPRKNPPSVGRIIQLYLPVYSHEQLIWHVVGVNGLLYNYNRITWEGLVCFADITQYLIQCPATVGIASLVSTSTECRPGLGAYQGLEQRSPLHNLPHWARCFQGLLHSVLADVWSLIRWVQGFLWTKETCGGESLNSHSPLQVRACSLSIVLLMVFHWTVPGIRADVVSSDSRDTTPSTIHEILNRLNHWQVVNSLPGLPEQSVVLVMFKSDTSCPYVIFTILINDSF